MATPSSLLSEDQFLCSICLDVFNGPVSIPCGHNFCLACIRKYWDSNGLSLCPMCQEDFNPRPELRVNTFISEMAAQFKKSVQVEAAASGQHPTKSGEVSCDICTGLKFKAHKSCLVCQTSFCEAHLEPHHIALALKRHKLIDPVDNLEDRMCKKHNRPLELFCRTDEMHVCPFCTETNHRYHITVPLEKHYRERKAQLGKTEVEVQKMIQERLEKVQKIKLSVKTIKRNAKKDISDSVEVFTALVHSIERSQAELIMGIEEKQKAAEKLAKVFIEDLENEIAELQRRSTDLEQLLRTEDHLHFLQSFPSLSTPPPTQDLSEIRVRGDLSVGTAVSHLEEILTKEMEKLAELRLKMMQQYAVDVTLDPDTAHHKLLLSEDGKQVRYGGNTRNKLPNNPERFAGFYLNVLGQQGFSSGRFYYELQVKGKTNWLTGVTRESINRKENLTWSPENGLWTLHQSGVNEHKAHAGPDVLLSLSEEPQKVGVFVDYEEGQVSFYDVEAKSHIYSFTGCTFTEKLYPYFNPSYNLDAPLIITHVNP